jgi:chromosome condensin MukBEF ATPase and DNA-binding subunit MukB
MRAMYSTEPTSEVGGQCRGSNGWGRVSAQDVRTGLKISAGGSNLAMHRQEFEKGGRALHRLLRYLPHAARR